MEQLEQKLNFLQRDFDGFKQGDGRAWLSHHKIHEGLKDFTADIKAIKEEFSKLRTDIKRLDTGVTGLFKRYDNLDEEIKTLWMDIEELQDQKPKKPKWKFWS